MRVPRARGLAATAIVHVSPGASVVPARHVFHVITKSLAFVPVRETPLIVNAPPPVLVTVTDLAPLVVPTRTEPKARLDGLTLAAGGAVPVTLSGTCCGLFGALSAI